MEKVNERWRQVRAVVRQTSPSTEGLLNSCRPLGIKDGILYLGFDSDLVKAKMEKAESAEITRQALAQVFGMDVNFRCIVSAGKKATLPPDVDSDGMVATALRDLGGEIVDIQ
jgi:hypothetical protein